MDKLKYLFSVLLGVAGIVGVCVWLYRRWKSSDDRPGFLVRLVLTTANLLFLGLVVGPLVVRFDYVAAFAGIPLAAVSGIVMALIWTPRITDQIGRRVGALYDGGDVPPDLEPFLSVAEAKRKVGKYAEAVAEITQQLEVFPEHFRAHLLLAEIQAENLHDLQAAAATLGRFVEQPGHAPKNLAFALTRLADWHLKLGRDPVAAREAFERIVALLPDSPEAHLAQQRIARLTTVETMAALDGRAPLKMPPPTGYVGLRPDLAGPAPAPEDPMVKAQELVDQLERFPWDNVAREELAQVYALGFHRVDLAAEQIEQLLAQSNVPEAHVTRWLNLLADLHGREGGDLAAARVALERLIARAPNSPDAEVAVRRLKTLVLETRGRKTSQAIPFGSGKPAPEGESARTEEPRPGEEREPGP